MRKKKYILFFIFFFIVLFAMHKVEAKNYSIQAIDMQVTIQSNGDLQVNETLQYYFEGSYNGIYITLPYGVNDAKYDSIRKQTSLLNDSFYNASDVTIHSISVLGKQFEKVEYAQNGRDGVYTIENTGSMKKIKIFSPTNYGSKTFQVSYTLKNLAVKHNDIGEIYYNFIGGEWDKNIGKLNIDIRLPQNKSKEKLYAFAHGPENGVVTIISQNHVNLYIENVKKRRIRSRKSIV